MGHERHEGTGASVAGAIAEVLLGAVASLALCACGPGPLPTQAHPLVSQAPASRREMSIDGGLVTLPTPGRVTVIDVWGTTCKPCVAMMPKLEALYHEKRGAGLSVVGVATDDNPGLVQQRIKELGVTYPNVMDAEGLIRGAYRASELPTTVVFDRRGKVRVVRLGGGEDDLRALRAAVETLLGEP